MKYFGKAQQAAQQIVNLFQTGQLPEALAHVFIRKDPAIPCNRWSWANRLLVYLADTRNARGIRQWNHVSRRVNKGAKAFYILVPLIKTLTINPNDEPEEEETRQFLIGFCPVPAFRSEDTHGAPLPSMDQQWDRWIDRLPMIEVTRHWGLQVGLFDGEDQGYQGYYHPGTASGLGVENLSTWAHELVHATDDRNQALEERGQHFRSETVAELGGAVLLTSLGKRHDADLGGAWQYIQSYARSAGKDPLRVCHSVLNRLCQVVALILDEAEKLAGTEVASATAGHGGGSAGQENSQQPGATGHYLCLRRDRTRKGVSPQAEQTG